MSTNQPLVSVVIPMYRVATLLPRGIEFIAGQTYTNLELLFVDDASPDNVVEIVERLTPLLQKQGMTVRLLRHNVNQGVAVARNTALDHATGEYIYSFDADDELAPNAIELMVSEALAKDADIVGCEWELIYEQKRRRMTQPKVTTGREAFESMCLGQMKWNLWLFMFRRSLLQSDSATPIRFIPSMNMGEDMMLMGKVFLRANRVSILPHVLYGYVKTNEGSLTNNYSDKHWMQVDANATELTRYVASWGQPDLDTLLMYLKLNLKLPLLISPRWADYARWSAWFPEANAYILSNPNLPARTKYLQWGASKKLWPLVWLYYWVVMRFLYSVLYK